MRGKVVLQLSAVVLAVTALVLFGRQIAAGVPRFATWIESLGPWGGALFVVGYALAIVVLVPGSILTLAGPDLRSVVRGTILVFLGAFFGSALAFLIARYVARRAIERRLAANPRFADLDRAVGDEGKKIVFLLRLSPVFPFTLLNYGLGLTRVRFVDYLVGSLGMLPGTVLYVYYGRLLGDVAAVASGAPVEKGWYAGLAVGLVATILVTVLVTRVARRSLERTRLGTDDGADGRGGEARCLRPFFPFSRMTSSTVAISTRFIRRTGPIRHRDLVTTWSCSVPGPPVSSPRRAPRG